jgi:histidine triad (HIT) family protein
MPINQGIRENSRDDCGHASTELSYYHAADLPIVTPGLITMMSDNLFLKIIEKKIPAKIAYEDDRALAFHDINPQAPVHVLIVPKKVIATHADLTAADAELIGHLHLVAVKLAEQLGLGDGYRLVINCKEQAGQTVPHLHMHLLGGRGMKWPPG